jgi:hypothetical protein
LCIVQGALGYPLDREISEFELGRRDTKELERLAAFEKLLTPKEHATITPVVSRYVQAEKHMILSTPLVQHIVEGCSLVLHYLNERRSFALGKDARELGRIIADGIHVRADVLRILFIPVQDAHLVACSLYEVCYLAEQLAFA